MTLPTASLCGAGILITRPSKQADKLSRLLLAAGANPIRFPVLEINPPVDADLAAAAAVIAELNHYDWAIFISANAVEWALKLCKQTLPSTLKLAVIGQASAMALQRHGFTPDLMPTTRFDSEALLALAPLQAAVIRGQRIVIFRGRGGRGLLGDTLRERGAEVDYAEVYQRLKPQQSPQRLIQHWQAGEVQAALVTSSESLRNFYTMLGAAGREYLLNTPLVVLSARAKTLADELAWQAEVKIAAEISDQGIVRALSGLLKKD